MKIHIFTEVFNCGKIGKIAIESFLKYHPDLKLNVYGSVDNEFVHPNINYINLKNEKFILDGFREGHLGTARLWNLIFKRIDTDIFIHFDSDVIFRGRIIDELIEKSNEYQLIGPYRNYKNNPNGVDNVRHLPDIVQTVCFAFNKHFLTKYDDNTFIQMIRGMHNPLGHPVIDFFDPVSFDILKNGGKIYHLDPDDVGGCNILGKRDNIFKEINNENTPFKIDFGRKLSHFSAVGSGMNFFKNGSHGVPPYYVNYAIDRYALFCKIFYGEDIGIDISKYKAILGVKEWF